MSLERPGCVYCLRSSIGQSTVFLKQWLWVRVPPETLKNENQTTITCARLVLRTAKSHKNPEPDKRYLGHTRDHNLRNNQRRKIPPTQQKPHTNRIKIRRRLGRSKIPRFCLLPGHGIMQFKRKTRCVRVA